MRKKPKNARAYHHGNLRATLIDVARRLIVDRGPHGFSLVEAATLAGVSPAAPYRHFRNKDALLASVALTGYETFADALETAWGQGKPDPLRAFMRMGEIYLDFARTERASYIAMFEAGLSGDEIDGLTKAGDRAFAILVKAATALGAKKLGADNHLSPEISPEMMAAHIWALSHGMASLFLTGDGSQKKPVIANVNKLFESAMLIYLGGLGVDIPADMV